MRRNIYGSKLIEAGWTWFTWFNRLADAPGEKKAVPSFLASLEKIWKNNIEMVINENKLDKWLFNLLGGYYKPILRDYLIFTSCPTAQVSSPWSLWRLSSCKVSFVPSWNLPLTWESVASWFTWRSQEIWPRFFWKLLKMVVVLGELSNWFVMVRGLEHEFYVP